MIPEAARLDRWETAVTVSGEGFSHRRSLVTGETNDLNGWCPCQQCG